MGEDNGAFPGGDGPVQGAFGPAEGLGAAVADEYRGEDVSSITKEPTPAEIEVARQERNREKAKGIDSFIEEAEKLNEEVASPTGKDDKRNLSEKMAYASKEYDQRLIQLLSPQMAAKRASLRGEITSRLEKEDKARPWYVKAVSAIFGKKRDYEKLAEQEASKTTDEQVLEGVIGQAIEIAEKGLIELSGHRSVRLDEYKGAKNLRDETLAKRNEAFDKYRQGKIKLEALEECITEDAKLLEDYLKKREKPDYNGEHDAIIEDIEARLKENEAGRERLMETVKGLGKSVFKLKHKYDTVSQRTKESEGHSDYFDRAYLVAEMGVEKLRELRDDRGKRKSLLAGYRLVAEMNNSPTGTIVKETDELVAKFLGFVYEEVKQQGWMPPYSSSALDKMEPIQKDIAQGVEEAIAEVAADRYTTRL